MIMKKNKKLVIVGDSAFAQIAYEYFQYDSEYEVVGFTVEKAFLSQSQLFGLPVVSFETIESHFQPQETFFYAASVYTQLNRLRTRFFDTLKGKGYKPASYISSHAFVWKNVKLGEHVFIFEDNTIQPFVEIQNNVVLWSGNHIGHHSIIRNNCFLASHVVVSGYCDVGENCFIGVNATLANNLIIANDCIIGAGATVTKNIMEDQVVKGIITESKPSAKRLFKVKE